MQETDEVTGTETRNRQTRRKTDRAKVRQEARVARRRTDNNRAAH